MTLHLSQMGLTLGLTFMSTIPCCSAGACADVRSRRLDHLLVAVDDPTSREVVRRELHHDPVLGEDPDVVLAHLAADVGEHLVPVGQLHAEHGVGKGLHDGALDLDHAFFLRHVLHNLLQCCLMIWLSTVAREPPGTCEAGVRWTSWAAPWN